MRIALLIEYLDNGGSERVVQRLARGLAARGHAVHLYCLRAAEMPLDDLHAAGIRVREARSFRRDLFLSFRLAGWLRRDQIDVAHAHSCAALAAVFPAARLLGIPLVHVWHGWPLQRANRAHRLARRLDRHAAAVVVNSEALCGRLAPRADAAATRRGRAPVVIHNGLDLPPVARPAAHRQLVQLCGTELDGPVVLSVGNLRPEKDTCGLLRAFADLRLRWPRARLVCLGAAWDRTYLHEVLRTRAALDLENSVMLAGPCQAAWRLMAGADVVCLSSRTESLPNVVLEAMSQQVPLVVTRVGDVEHVLRHDDTALLVPPADPAALASALHAVLADPARARDRAARAYAAYRARFTTAHMVDGYERVYRRCMPGRSRSPSRVQRSPQPSALPEATLPRSAQPARPRPGACAQPVVLMLGPAAPQIGGMVSAIDALMESPLRECFTLLRLATPVPRSAAGTRGVPGVRGRMVDRLELAPAIQRHLAALAELARTVRRWHVDLVHIHTCSHRTFYRSVVDLLLVRLLGRQALLHIRGGQFARFCSAAGPLGRWVIRAAARQAAAVIVLSEHWRRALRPHLPGPRLYVVPNGVAAPAADDPAEQTTQGGQRPRPCRFLFLGALCEAKGLGDLLAAAELLRARRVSFELVIAGPAATAESRSWRARFAAAGLSPIVTFMKPVRGGAKTRLLRDCDCLVHPSHSEGLPNVILEAAAAGLPVIATAVGSVPEVLRPDPRQLPLAPLIPPHDAAALAAAMRLLVEEPRLRRQIALDLSRHIRTLYSLERTARDLSVVYATCLALPPVTEREARREITGDVTQPKRADSPATAEAVAGAFAPVHGSARDRPADPRINPAALPSDTLVEVAAS